MSTNDAPDDALAASAPAEAPKVAPLDAFDAELSAFLAAPQPARLDPAIASTSKSANFFFI